MNYCGLKSEKETGMGGGRKHIEGGYFVATHCTMAVAGISQMCMYHQPSGVLWENTDGWAHLGTMIGKTANWKYMANWYEVLSLAWKPQLWEERLLFELLVFSYSTNENYLRNNNNNNSNSPFHKRNNLSWQVSYLYDINFLLYLNILL